MDGPGTRVASDTATGDVLLFCGSHPMIRRQWEVTCCPWGQVALVLHLDDRALVFESTRASTCPDILRCEVVEGVQLSSLTERVGSFEGAVALRRLDPPLSGGGIEMLIKFAREVYGLPFNNSPWEAVRARRRRNVASGWTSFFCSELVAAAYQRIGLLLPPPMGWSPNNYIPADFSTKYADSIVQLQGSALTDEILLKGTPNEVLQTGHAMGGSS